MVVGFFSEMLLKLNCGRNLRTEPKNQISYVGSQVDIHWQVYLVGVDDMRMTVTLNNKYKSNKL